MVLRFYLRGSLNGVEPHAQQLPSGSSHGLLRSKGSVLKRCVNACYISGHIIGYIFDVNYYLVKKKKKHKSRRPSRRIAHRQLRRKFKMERSHAVHHPSLRNWQSSKGALGTSATRCPEQVVSSHKHNQSQLSSPRRQEPQPMQARSIPQETLKNLIAPSAIGLNQ